MLGWKNQPNLLGSEKSSEDMIIKREIATGMISFQKIDDALIA